MPEWFVLVGVLVLVVGFLLKVDVIAVVIVAALATMLAAGETFAAFVDLLGKSFVDNRAASLFLLTLPMIALRRPLPESFPSSRSRSCTSGRSDHAVMKGTS